MVVKLGGLPAIDERAPVYLEAPTKHELLNLNIEAERMAIDVYSKQLKDIKDENMERIFERIIEDETSHLHIFKDLQQKIKEDASESSQVLDDNKVKIAKYLNEYLQKQYQKILETLHQYFITREKDPYLGDELEQRAIDKMKHFGWVAEEVPKFGIKPNVGLPSVSKVNNKQDIIDYQLKDQEEFPKEIKDMSNVVPSEDLRWILDRISKRELHYTDLKLFLENPDTKEEDIKKVVYTLTVGSLFKKKST